MRKPIIGVLALAAVVVIGGFGFVYAGIYNVAASDPHWGLVYKVLETVRIQSIKAHARGIEVPKNLKDEATVVMGTDHFAAHCAVCHGAPGVPKGDIAHGLYPAPPDLAHAAAHLSPGELFWTVKNGLKMTGMPSWKDHTDAELWSTVAFMQRLPGMTEEEYGKLIMASMNMGSEHHHGGAEPMKDEHEHP
ncbi:MAG: cytochrome c [Rhodospirillaceae bacterium]|nr:cytochrome c [Rhodospirillaceae bacterium]